MTLRAYLLRKWLGVVVMRPATFDRLLDRLEDAEDRLSIYESDDEEVIDFDKAVELIESGNIDSI